VSDVIIDSHMHLFRELSDDFPRGTHELYPAERSAVVDEYLITARDAGVDHAIFVSLDENDEYMSHILAQHPGRFSAVAVMNAASNDPVTDFRRHIDSVPLVGYRIWTLGANESLQVPDAYVDLLASMEEQGIAAWFYSDEMQLRALAGIVHRFPNLPVILNHLGICQSGFRCDEWGRPRVATSIPPDTQWIVDDLAQHENVAVLFSGHYAFSEQDYPYTDLLETSDRLLQAFGANRLLWASDWPWIANEPGYAAIGDLVRIHLPGLSSREMGHVMGGNAIRLLGIEVNPRDEES